MKHISDLLNKRVKQSGLSNNIETALIIEEFERLIQQIFGYQIMERIKPIYIKKTVLYVPCYSSVLVQELSLQKDYFLSALTKKFGREVVTDIKISL